VKTLAKFKSVTVAQNQSDTDFGVWNTV